MRASTWISKTAKASLREMMRACPDVDVRAEGLACLRGDKPEFLTNLIPQNHPDRIAAMRWLTRYQD